MLRPSFVRGQCRSFTACASPERLRRHQGNTATTSHCKISSHNEPQTYQRVTCCTAVAKYPPGGSYVSDDEVENKGVFESDDELEDNAREIAVDMARLAWDTKVEDITVVDVAAQTSICSYMVIATVFSRPQLNAVLGKMEKVATEKWNRDYTMSEGRSAWEALDMGDVLVHVMSEEARHYYNLEGLYGTGTPVELPFLTEEEKAKRDVWTTKL